MNNLGIDQEIYNAILNDDVIKVAELYHQLNNGVKNNLIQMCIDSIVPCYKVLEFFISKGVDINRRLENGMTFLHLSIQRELEPEFIELLCPGNINVEDNNGYTPLMMTFDVEIAKILVKYGENVNAVNSKSLITPLMTAVRYSNIEMVKFLIDQGSDIQKLDSENWSAIFYSLHASSDIFNLLIDKGIELNTVDKHGFNLLMYEIEYTKRYSHYRLKKLIEKGINFNHVDGIGMNCLMYACALSASYSDLDTVMYLSTIIDINVVDYTGLNCLDYCLKTKDKQAIPVIKFLIDKGIDIQGDFVKFEKFQDDELTSLVLRMGLLPTSEYKDYYLLHQLLDRPELCEYKDLDMIERIKKGLLGDFRIQVEKFYQKMIEKCYNPRDPLVEQRIIQEAQDMGFIFTD